MPFEANASIFGVSIVLSPKQLISAYPISSMKIIITFGFDTFELSILHPTITINNRNNAR